MFVILTAVELLTEKNNSYYLGIIPWVKSGELNFTTIDFIVDNYPELDHDQKEFLKNKTFYGWEIVQSTRRLCLMNRQEKQYDHHQRRRHPEKRRSDL